MEDRHPKVFISHASEDKERFVRSFARDLRANGVDAWFDEWEILPGDSLVDKLFEEGIGLADAVIVVLSKHSVQSAWVREELNASVVRRVSDQCKLIPVIIDDCGVPEALKSTVWVRIYDPDNHSAELGQIIASIYGRSDKPALGTPPAYTVLEIPDVAGLTRTDALVLKTIGDVSLELRTSMLGTSQILGTLQELGLTEDVIMESIEVLADRGIIVAAEGYNTTKVSLFDLTSLGFGTFARAFLPGVDRLMRDTLVAIVNHGLTRTDDVSAHLGECSDLVNRILGVLAQRGLIAVFEVFGGNNHITEVTAQGRRAVRQW